MLQSMGSKSQTETTRMKMGVLKLPGSTVVKNPLAVQEMWVQSLGWEDPLAKKMATHSSILAWEIPWTKEPGRLQPTGVQSGMQLRMHAREPFAKMENIAI